MKKSCVKSITLIDHNLVVSLSGWKKLSELNAWCRQGIAHSNTPAPKVKVPAGMISKYRFDYTEDKIMLYSNSSSIYNNEFINNRNWNKWSVIFYGNLADLSQHYLEMYHNQSLFAHIDDPKGTQSKQQIDYFLDRYQKLVPFM